MLILEKKDTSLACQWCFNRTQFLTTCNDSNLFESKLSKEDELDEDYLNGNWFVEFIQIKKSRSSEVQIELHNKYYESIKSDNIPSKYKGEVIKMVFRILDYRQNSITMKLVEIE